MKGFLVLLAVLVGFTMLFGIFCAFADDSDLRISVPVGLDLARQAAGTILALAGGLTLLIRAVEAASLRELVGCVLVVLSGALVAAPHWAAATSLGAIGAAVALGGLLGRTTPSRSSGSLDADEG